VLGPSVGKATEEKGDDMARLANSLEGEAPSKWSAEPCLGVLPSASDVGDSTVSVRDCAIDDVIPPVSLVVALDIDPIVVAGESASSSPGRNGPRPRGKHVGKDSW
jgi:hypothetical protein